MTTLEIFYIVILSIIALILIIYLLIKGIKNKWINQLMDTLEYSMKEIEEKYPEGHGAEKQEYVLNALKSKCTELSIPYSWLVSVLVKIIKDIINNYNIFAK